MLFSVFNQNTHQKKISIFFARIENIFNSDYETMGVLGEVLQMK